MSLGTRRTDEFCEGYPHNLVPTPGYWIECSRQSRRGRCSTDHGIQEENSQEADDTCSSGDEEAGAGAEGRPDEEDDDAKDSGAATAKSSSTSSGQRGHNGSSVFAASETGAGRKVQHQNIQVSDERPDKNQNANCTHSHTLNLSIRPHLVFSIHSATFSHHHHRIFE